jgi:hypothetical protein
MYVYNQNCDVSNEGNAIVNVTLLDQVVSVNTSFLYLHLFSFILHFMTSEGIIDALQTLKLLKPRSP